MTNKSETDRGGLVARACVLAAAAAFLAVAEHPAFAESIWDKRDRACGFLYTDNVAADVGDSLTILISDTTSIKNKGERKAEKSTSSTGSFKIDTGLGCVALPSGDVQESSERKFQGTSDYKSTREFLDSITVTVIDRLPNGNLVVAGRSQRSIDSDNVVTILTGVVKPEDISGANTISSARVAHLSLHYEETGPTPSFAGHGWLSRIFNYVWPF
jgi:flagellar L-ring protein precursor FlgH